MSVLAFHKSGNSSAALSGCGAYRYELTRCLRDEGGKTFGYFGINPSTADSSIDDATVRKWRGFTLANGGDVFIVGNVFAYRATDVRELASVADPVGIENDTHIQRIIDACDVLVPCWGNASKVPQQLRWHIHNMGAQLRGAGKPVLCFGRTKSGDPKHPLMLGYDTELVPF